MKTQDLKELTPMNTKIRSMLLVCSLAVVAMAAPASSCPKETATAVADTPVVVRVVDTAPACSKSRQAIAVQASASDKAAGCPKARSVAMLVKALQTMPDCAAKADVARAIRTMAVENPGLVSDKKLAKLCGSIQTAQVANVSQCSKAKATRAAAKATQVSASSCDPAACAAACAAAIQVKAAAGAASACCASKAKTAKATKVAAGQSVCTKAQQAAARYVAFGCDKTDRVARVAAQAYFSLIRELKAASGAEGCSAAAATEVLTAVLNDLRAERTAKAPIEVKSKTVADIETVNFGAVSDKKSACSGSRN